MSHSVLVTFATRYGSTQEVADAIAATLRESGLSADVKALKDVQTLTEYGAVVMGAPLFMFRWHKDALRFLTKHHKTLIEMPVAVFASGPVHDPHDEKEWQDSHDQLNKELAKFPWFKPVAREIFGGRYDPAQLRFPLKMFAGAEPASDIRNWESIRTWAASLGIMLREHTEKS